MTQKAIQIAIDGPASSGKSTVAKLISQELGYTYLDTGAMYRAVTYMALSNGLSAKQVPDVLDLLKTYSISFGRAEDGQQLVYIGDVDVTNAIRENDVTNNVSAFAAIPEVREALVALQQEIAKDGGIVMDGRDIGTVVLPQAQVKIFLIASVEERAERRFKENQARGIATNLEQLKAEITERDYKDSHRRVSPLRPAEDAIMFDTTGVSIPGVVAFILEKVKKALDEA